MNLLINCNAKQIPLADGSVNCVVTSPPYYGLRDYNVDGQIGLEQTPAEYVNDIVQVFREVKRVLRDDGTLWLNLGDSYFNLQNSNRNGLSESLGGKVRGGGEYKTQKRNAGNLPIKEKDLIGIPWMVAFALRDDGWYLRQDIIWAKPNPMPESVKDRCTKAHEYIFLLSKSPHYYYDYEAVLEPANNDVGKPRAFAKKGNGDRNDTGNVYIPKYYKNLQDDGQQPNTTHLKRLEGEEYVSPVRNRRSVWTIPTSPYRGAHYATFPPKLIEPMILAGCPAGGIVLDPFVGSGTTVMVANHLGRKGIGLDLNFKYLKDNAKERIATVQPIMFN